MAWVRRAVDAHNVTLILTLNHDGLPNPRAALVTRYLLYLLGASAMIRSTISKSGLNGSSSVRPPRLVSPSPSVRSQVAVTPVASVALACVAR